MPALLALILAAHAEPPSRELLDDLDRWERGQDAFLDGPPGCWDLTGNVRQVVTLHQPPDRFSAARHEQFPMVGTVKGRMIDGLWQGKKLEQDTKPEGHPHEFDVPVYPLFGTFPEDPNAPKAEETFTVSVGESGGAQIGGSIGQSVNVLREAVEEWSGSVETSLAQWDEAQQAVLYLRELPLSDEDDRPIQVTVRFPAAGERADRIDAVWPALIKLGQWPVRFTIRDAQMHAVGHPHQDVVLPWAESLSFVGGGLGYTFGYEQAVTWRSATPCSAAAAPAAPPPGTPEVAP